MAEAPGASKKIGFVDVFIIIFSAVGSGPAGIEGIAGSAGISLALIGVVLFPLVWGAVQALVSVELALKFRNVNGAIAAWSHALFGASFARNTALWVLVMQCSMASFVSNVSVSYAQAFWPGTLGTYAHEKSLMLAVIVFSLLVNMVGMEWVARTFWVFSVNTLVTFAVFVGIAAPRVSLKNLKEPWSQPVAWSQFVNLLIFNSSGFDSGASVVSMVAYPQHDVPRAMAAAGLAVALLYVTTIAVPFLATSLPQERWTSGAFVTIAREMGGEPLAAWVFFACILTNLQIFTSALLTAGYTTSSMAAQGVFPSFLRANDDGKPMRALAACAFLSVCIGFAPLVVDLSIASTLCVLIMLSEAACFVRARSGDAFVAGSLARRAIVCPMVAVATFVLVAQDARILYGVCTCVALVALWTVPVEAAFAPSAISCKANMHGVTVCDGGVTIIS